MICARCHQLFNPLLLKRGHTTFIGELLCGKCAPPDPYNAQGIAPEFEPEDEDDPILDLFSDIHDGSD